MTYGSRLEFSWRGFRLVFFFFVFCIFLLFFFSERFLLLGLLIRFGRCLARKQLFLSLSFLYCIRQFLSLSLIYFILFLFCAFPLVVFFSFFSGLSILIYWCWKPHPDSALNGSVPPLRVGHATAGPFEMSRCQAPT